MKLKSKMLMYLKLVKNKKTTIPMQNLRIAKSNEPKPEIKKIKKQATEKKLYKPKDYTI